MVRIKERYLLVNILYPNQLSATTNTNGASKNSDVPDLVALHQPTTDKLTHGALLREIRAEVASLFGDYGSGAVSSLQSEFYLAIARPPPASPTFTLLPRCTGLSSDMSMCKIVKYLSQATSTFILRVNRAHYRLVWTALTMMDHVPVRDGKLCTYRVVHVSGTIRKIEEEAIRRDRDLMFAVKSAAEGKNNSALAAIMGEGNRTRQQQSDLDVVDVEDNSEDEEMADFNND